jgi:hypothetical protein
MRAGHGTRLALPRWAGQGVRQALRLLSPCQAKRGPMPDADNDARIVKSTDQARAGETGQHVRQVLLTSLIAAILLLIVIAAVQFS